MYKVDSSSLSLSVLQEDTAKVISSMLMVSGLSTLLHSFFGSRLPLIQGASFVYLAPALAIIFSTELYGLKKDVRLRSPHYLTICICILQVELFNHARILTVLISLVGPRQVERFSDNSDNLRVMPLRTHLFH